MVVRLSDTRSKTGKNIKNAFLSCFRPYVGEPDNHIGWATSMPFTSINPITNPRTNPWNFCEKILRIGGVENLRFFELAILIFVFKKKFFFESFPWKSVKIYMVATRKILAMRNNTLHSVGIFPFHQTCAKLISTKNVWNSSKRIVCIYWPNWAVGILNFLTICGTWNRGLP